ncbi:hypothetical protein FM113_07585 [Leucobacter sp. 7(1)]|uniref:hypothetical protein n=1 Tax=Leucobacter sp. 7(1) TaxID=1255613 RepID=UPI00097F1673|nr:hypothetical protein [Leucobacter sp. 7(1)]SJN09903.1 hypothetical protein FM113_07585 [Leucobacter sp. 7(1)]
MSNNSPSDIGSQTRSWGPFRYAEGYGVVEVERRGGMTPSSAKVTLRDNGYLDVTTSAQQELYVDDEGMVTVMPKPAGQEVRVSADGLVTVDFSDGSTVMVTPDGQIHRVTAEEVTVPVSDSPVTGLVESDAVTQSTAKNDAVIDRVPTEKDEQIDWLVTRARAGEDVSWRSTVQLFSNAGVNVSDRTIQRRLREARQQAPEAFADAEEAEDLVKAS